MDYKVNSTDQGLKIEIDGTLTFENHREFKGIIEAIRDTQENVEISLKGLKNMDSAGAGMLKLAQDKAQQNGKDFKISEVPEDLKMFVSLLK